MVKAIPANPWLAGSLSWIWGTSDQAWGKAVALDISISFWTWCGQFHVLHGASQVGAASPGIPLTEQMLGTPCYLRKDYKELTVAQGCWQCLEGVV